MTNSTTVTETLDTAGNAAQGGVLFQDALVYSGHIHTMGDPTAYRGWLIVETKRHVAGLGDLTDEEAAAVGQLVNRVARVQGDRRCGARLRVRFR